MQALYKAKKCDLINLCEECGINVPEKITIPALIKLIKDSADYEEDFIKNRLEVITMIRRENEQAEHENEQRKLQAELEEKRLQAELEEKRLQAEIKKENEERKLQLEEKKLRLEFEEKERQREFEEKERQREFEEKERQREFEIKKMQMQKAPEENMAMDRKTSSGKQYELLKLLTKYENNNDIDLYLSMYERQMIQVGIDKKEWVTYLINLMPLDIVNMINRENEPEIHDYNHIKRILLKRYKLSPEEFRQKFFSRKKETSVNWRDFAYEIKMYFEQWVEGLEVNNFEDLSELMIVNQIRHNLPTETKEHFVEELLVIKKIEELVNKLDTYETARRVCMRPTTRNVNNNMQDKKSRMINYANLKGRQMDNQYSVNHERNDSRIVCFRCNRPGHVSAKCTNMIETQQENPNINPQRNQSWRETKSWNTNPSLNQNMQRKTVQIGTLNGKRGRIINTQGINANVIIDTGSDISIANSKYYAAINSPRLTEDNITISGIGGEVIKPMGFFSHKVCIDDIEVQDKFYVVEEESDYDLIIGRKAIEGLNMSMVDGDVKLISSNNVHVGYVKINEVHSKTNKIDMPDIKNDNRNWEDIVNIECAISEVDLTHSTEVTHRDQIRQLKETYKIKKTKDTGLRMKILLEDKKLFIGGISRDTNQKDLKEYFSKFGEVTEVNIKTDPTSGRSRGFAFVAFGSRDSVDSVLRNGPHTIKGKHIEAKRAKVRPGIKMIFVGGIESDMTGSEYIKPWSIS